MTQGILNAAGGIGMFLIGMLVMTDGLRELAGESLRRILTRFTRNPSTGAMTGALTTAAIQSSSATTVMAVGFVGAGLLTFTQALGIIFGANIGTTVTGWLVALLGFKLKLKEIVLPLILLGALMRVFGKKRLASVGISLAGFGLVFAGIAMLQSGMEAFHDVVTPEYFPPDTLFGRFLLVLIGGVITLVTQSSSAGVAMAITAVHVGNISLAQGAAMVIGMDVGTTVTAAMAAVGGNVSARRTGLAHVIYNVMTGIFAFLLLPLFVFFWEQFATASVRLDSEIALVAFHTSFNAIGVLAVLPFTNHFAKLIVRIIPARENELARRLEPSLMKHPQVAVDAALATLFELTNVVFHSLRRLLSSNDDTDLTVASLEEASQALIETRHYINKIKITEENERLFRRNVTLLHGLDHLARLIARTRKSNRVRNILADKELSDMSDELKSSLDCDINNPSQAAESSHRLEHLWTKLDSKIEPFRHRAIEMAAAGDASPDQTIKSLDSIRWLRRACYHAWRIVHHLAIEPEIVQQGAKLELDDELEDPD